MSISLFSTLQIWLLMCLFPADPKPPGAHVHPPSDRWTVSAQCAVCCQRYEIGGDRLWHTS